MFYKNNYEAWRIDIDSFPERGNVQQKLQFLVRLAVLAPSSHNTQPWSFRIKENSIDILVDLSRHLKYSDPDKRMLYEAIGAAIQHIKLACRYYGLDCKILYNPRLRTSTPELVATIEIQGSKKPEQQLRSTIESITKRRSNRGGYVDRPISESTQKGLRDLAGREAPVYIETDFDKKKKISRIAGEGMKEKMAERSFRWELARWLRNNLTWRHDGMPGSGHGMSFTTSLLAPWILRFVDVSSVEKERAITQVEEFPAIAVLSTPADSAYYFVKAGEVMECLLLHISSNGMGARIMVAPIESEGARTKLQQFIYQEGISRNMLPQMFFGFGVTENKAPHSPRRGIKNVLTK